LRLSVEAHPNARRSRLDLVDTTLRVWVMAPAVDGRANKAIEQTIAHALGVGPREVRIVSGARGRHKLVEIDLADIDEVRRRLRAS
jgi:uncharacterized protein (TIGR00251 family)